MAFGTSLGNFTVPEVVYLFFIQRKENVCVISYDFSLRLENEHLNNVGEYRAFKSLPLPFITDEDKVGKNE